MCPQSQGAQFFPKGERDPTPGVPSYTQQLRHRRPSILREKGAQGLLGHAPKQKTLIKREGIFVNRILKQRAKKLYRETFGRTILVYLLYLFYLLVTTMPAVFLQDWLTGRGIGEWWSFLLAALLQMTLLLLLGPLNLGVTRYVYLLQKDRSPGAGEAFYYFTAPGRYGKGILAGFLQGLPGYLTLVITSIMDGTGSDVIEILLVFLLIAAYIFSIYWALHICLLPYILVEDEGAQLGHIRRESFRLMSGSCGRYFLLNLSFIGWYLLIIAVVFVGLLVVMVPVVYQSIQLGMPDLDALTQPFSFWTEIAVYVLMTLLAPYVSLTNAGFGDAALQGKVEELVWQGRMPYGGYPTAAGPWQQPPSYPPYPQGGPRTTSWQGQPGAPAWNQPPQPGPVPQGNPYTAAQQEEVFQYERYRQGQPMEPKSFTTYSTTGDPRSFLPWLQIEQSSLYSFLKLESWMPGMIAAAWQQAALGLSAQSPENSAAVKRTLDETLSGNRFRVTVMISSDPSCPGLRQVCIRIDLNPPA